MDIINPSYGKRTYHLEHVTADYELTAPWTGIVLVIRGLPGNSYNKGQQASPNLRRTY